MDFKGIKRVCFRHGLRILKERKDGQELKMNGLRSVLEISWRPTTRVAQRIRLAGKVRRRPCLE